MNNNTISHPRFPGLVQIEQLVYLVRSAIEDSFRANEGEEKPGIFISVDATGKYPSHWGYRVGNHRHSRRPHDLLYWGSSAVYRDSNPREVAHDILAQLEEAWFEVNG